MAHRSIFILTLPHGPFPPYWFFRIGCIRDSIIGKYSAVFGHNGYRENLILPQHGKFASFSPEFALRPAMISYYLSSVSLLAMVLQLLKLFPLGTGW